MTPTYLVTVIQCMCEVKSGGLIEGTNVNAMCKNDNTGNELFCAFKSTKVWSFNAVAVGILHCGKTFTDVLYDVQNN